MKPCTWVITVTLPYRESHLLEGRGLSKAVVASSSITDQGRSGINHQPTLPIQSLFPPYSDASVSIPLPESGKVSSLRSRGGIGHHGAEATRLLGNHPFFIHTIPSNSQSRILPITHSHVSPLSHEISCTSDSILMCGDKHE